MTYTAGYGGEIVADLARRTAHWSAAFFLPHLRSGMDLLDCGCGPGSITLDLADAVAPGRVTGIDVNAGLIDRARAAAAARQISNTDFQVADVRSLPFPDASFDAVFAHAVLEHVPEPGAALREMRRVLKDGGVVGVRDADHGGVLLAPASPALNQAMELWARIWKRNGGDPEIGRKHRGLLRQAGFAEVAASASFDFCGVGEDTRIFADIMSLQFSESDSAKTIIALGWATAERLAEIAAAWRDWGAHPDAFFARPRCEAVGWKR